jgi:hypothetical protein
VENPPRTSFLHCSLYQSTMTSPDEVISFSKNRKGGDLLVDSQNYTYVKSKTVVPKDCIYWICTSKKVYSCPATLDTSLTTKSVVSKANVHTHNSKMLEMKVLCLLNLFFPYE